MDKWKEHKRNRGTKMKSFYNEYEALNDRGKQANGEIHRFMDDLFNRWVAMGFSTRELQSIVSEELIATSAEKRLLRAFEMHKDEAAKNRVQDYEEAIK